MLKKERSQGAAEDAIIQKKVVSLHLVSKRERHLPPRKHTTSLITKREAKLNRD